MIKLVEEIVLKYYSKSENRPKPEEDNPRKECVKPDFL
jgi:hypothetical protein